jgi:hypothetical protein
LTEREPGPARLRSETVAFGFVDGAVVTFAWFTLLAHLWDIVNGRTTVLLVVWVMTAPLVQLALRRFGSRSLPGRHEPPAWTVRLQRATAGHRRRLVVAAMVCAVTGSVLLGTSTRASWLLGWALALIAVVVGGLAVVIAGDGAGDGARDSDPRPALGHRAARTGLAVAVIAGLGLGLCSLFTVSPTDDDTYYVNRTTWIAQHGSIPDHDTVFSHDRLPSLYEPAIGTFETFAGAVGHLTGASGATMSYLVLGPMLLALLPLALWRAIVAVRLDRPVLGLVVALTFLVMTGGGQQWFGEMVLRRPWQTKEMFAAVMVPLLYGYALEFGRTRRVGAAALAPLAVVCSVGLTSSAAALAPAVVVVLAVTGYLCWGSRFLAPLAVALVYPLICLFAYRQGGSSSAFSSTTRAAYHVPYDLWHWFLGAGLVGVLVGLALSAGYLGSGWRPARLALLGGALAVLVALSPRVLDAAGPLLGGAPTAWRMTWVAPLLLLVAGVVPAVGAVAVVAGRRLPGRALTVVAAVVVAALAALGTPVSSSTDTHWSARPRFDLGPEAAAAADLVRLARNRGTVAGPEPVNLAVAVAHAGDVLALDPRSYYGQLLAKRAHGAMKMRRRVQLTLWLTGGIGGLPNRVQAARLAQWPVTAVCVNRAMPVEEAAAVVTALRRAGYRSAGSDRFCELLARPG